ncbi:hypothetical protein PUNSTDRAFT_71023 [Punctularia strigosozonata HHB-11173 SS5]|uniref:uncharacterized protein n=1 Tax=Punctularia strigosozonata (strain HHB-11173) TaxID=741275 RepID=UPI000441667F|nr:uncharacterized protein PUNSTDRAFT_71023 [Punctularia strigosozonata HHB-11173 SS5]EIN06999.1 hypothetical protein PUNSTDRAFT_71023 [Punctularia strigosozonata HHB-11173 SS5]
MTTDQPRPPICRCRDHQKTLSVLAVFIDRAYILSPRYEVLKEPTGLERIDVPVCTCTSAAMNILARGLFPCAPQAPSVAFDLNMLELIATLFVNTPPNITAWATTLECFLGVRKHRVTSRDSLRRRFGNALNWYNYLIDCVRQRTLEAVERSRCILSKRQVHAIIESGGESKPCTLV